MKLTSIYLFILLSISFQSLVHGSSKSSSSGHIFDMEDRFGKQATPTHKTNTQQRKPLPKLKPLDALFPIENAQDVDSTNSQKLSNCPNVIPVIIACNNNLNPDNSPTFSNLSFHVLQIPQNRSEDTITPWLQDVEKHSPLNKSCPSLNGLTPSPAQPAQTAREINKATLEAFYRNLIYAKRENGAFAFTFLNF